jgi:hypothetical protein
LIPSFRASRYQELWRADEDAVWTRPYSPTHRSNGIPEMGASLRAFMHLAHKRNMRLVGCHKEGYNAFFVRNGLGDDLLGSEEYGKLCNSYDFAS